MGLLLLILPGSLVRRERLAQRPLPREDKMLECWPMAVPLELMVGLSTVSRGERALMLFIAGWLRGMKPTLPEIRSLLAPYPDSSFRKYRFEHRNCFTEVMRKSDY